MPTLDFVNSGGYGLLLTEGFDAVVLLVGLISIVRRFLLRFTVDDLHATEQLDDRHVGPVQEPTRAPSRSSLILRKSVKV